MDTTDNAHRTIKLLGGWSLVAALAALAVLWGNGISMDLMLAVMSVVGFFSGEWLLPFQADWVGMAIRLAAVTAMTVLIVRIVRYQRASKGDCGRCGRGERPPRDYRRLAGWAAGLAAIPAAGYAALKLHWAFGGTIGLADPDMFAGVEPWTPGFADTAVMAAIGIALAAAMATRMPRIPRWLLLTPALIGCAMLLPVAVLGTIANIGGAATGGLSPWVGWFVYTCFSFWGAGLAIVTVEYHYGTRRACRVCGRG